MEQYLTDEEIVEEIRKGDRAKIEFLLEKYKSLVRAKAKTMYLLGGDKDDLVQEGMIGLFQAIRDYEPEKESLFSAFAALCVSRQIYTAVQKDQRQKNIPLNSYISLYSEGGKEGGTTLLEELSPATDENPESLFIAKENEENIKKAMESALSRMEQEVVAMKMSGMDTRGISELLGKNSKQVENAFHRGKDKLKKELQKHS